MTDNHSSQRVDALLDFRIEDVKEDIAETRKSVNRIEKILIGNGSEGLIQKVSKNTANIKIILWVLSIIVGGALVGGAVVKKVNQNDDTANNTTNPLNVIESIVE